MASGEAPVKAGLFVMVKPLIAAEKVFEHAECFYQASVALRNQLPVRLRPDHSENIHAAITLTEPLIVLDALTSELFLKCLICIETGDTPRGHNLERLFNQLSKATRTRIQSYWDSEISTRRREKWDNFERVGLKVSRDLPTALANGNNAFERYRYSYEGNTQDLHYYLEDLPPLLERLILEMKPEFEAFRRGPLPSQQMLHQ
jgi:hypothetical protein